MKTDIEIAREVKPKKITSVAKKLGVNSNDLILYGNYKAKLAAKPQETPKGKLFWLRQ